MVKIGLEDFTDLVVVEGLFRTEYHLPHSDKLSPVTSRLWDEKESLSKPRSRKPETR